jgi:hypothetical protein
MHAETEGEDTLLRGAVADQPALYGLRAVLEALGLDLLEVRGPAMSPRPPACSAPPEHERQPEHPFSSGILGETEGT